MTKKRSSNKKLTRWLLIIAVILIAASVLYRKLIYTIPHNNYSHSSWQQRG